MTDSNQSNNQASAQAKLRSSLANILTITQEMLVQANNNAWDEVVSMESERRHLLDKFFSSPIEDDESGLISEALAAMLHINEELIGLLENAKASVAIKRTQQRYTNKSLECYLDIDS